MIDPAPTPPEGSPSIAQKRLIALIAVFAVVNIAYRLVYRSGEQRTAALYIGVPAILAIGLTLVPRGRSATGMLMKGSVLALLLAAIVLPEGFICLLFVVPLVAVIALVVGGAIDLARRHRRPEGPVRVLVAIPLLLMSMEGVIGSPFDTHGIAEAHRDVAVSAADVATFLAMAPEFEGGFPTFLSVGFNRPVHGHGEGLHVGDTRVIEFTGGSHDEHPLGVAALRHRRPEEPPSIQRLRIAAVEPGRVVFVVDEDTTMLARWADLDRAVVTWRPLDERHTRVTWRLEYNRLIQPTMYFAPLQRFAMQQGAGYLLDALVVHRATR